MVRKQEDEIMNVMEELKVLKNQKNAVIMAHFYQLPEIQEAADFVGDSLELAKISRETKADVIVLCGVRFMAETAKILCPDKTVLLPEPNAGCPMADMVTAEDVLQLREAHPHAAVICYVNSDITVKAVSDICCTSANALQIARSLQQEEIIFVPDQCLGGYIAKFLPEKRFILAPGFCPTHRRITASDADASRKARPNARMLVHPECSADVIERADFVGSTAQLIQEAIGASEREFLIGTEEGVLHRLNKLCPDKQFFSIGRTQTCPNMKRTRMEHLRIALQDQQHEIEVDQEQARKAIQSLERMFAVSVLAEQVMA